MPAAAAIFGRPKPAWRRALADRLFVVLCITAAAACVVILFVLLGAIVRQGWSRLDWAFLTNYPSRHAAGAGFKAALWGSVWLCAVCAALALPIGVAAAVLLEEYPPRNRWMRRAHAFIQVNIQNLAGVPSIVYGIIGLTVFVRFFGLFGNPNQYDQMIRATLADGSVITGSLVEDRAASAVIDITGVEGATRAEGMDWPAGVEFSLASIEGDAALVLAANPGDRVAIVVARDLNLPLDLGFALEPIDDSDPPPRITVQGVLRARRDGVLILDHPKEGRIEIPSTDVRRRSIVSVRAHEITLASGRRLRADSISPTPDAVALIIGGQPTRIGRGDIAEYRALGPFAIGREDSLFHARLPLGGSVIAGALTLMLVVLPVVIISSQEALRAVPRSLREGALAAGATRWQVVSRMTLPAAMPGILTGAILAMSRAIGEAAPLLVIGGILFITFTPRNMMSDFAAMPLQIYQWASRPQTDFYAVAAAGIIVLLVVLLLFNAAAILLRQRFQSRAR